MRLIKMFGLAASAAVAAMAFVGASSAMADGGNGTAICKQDELACAAANLYPANTTVLASLLNPGLTGVGASLLGPNLVLEVTCFQSHSKSKTLAALASPLTGHLEELSFSHCFHKTGVACTVTINHVGELLLLKTAANLGTATVHNVSATVECGISPVIFRCFYKTNAMPMHALGTGLDGTAAMLVADHAELTEEKKLTSIGCPTRGLFDGAYEILSPTPAYVSL